MRKNKDWSGNGKTVFATLGASSHSAGERETNDYYATDPKAAKLLLELESFNRSIWEPACGEGHLSKVFTDAGYDVRSSDLIDRGFGEVSDFLAIDNLEWDGDIVTNPPFKYATDFIVKALNIIPEGSKVAMFLKLQFMESDGRKHLFVNTPPHTIYVSSNRIECGMNGVFKKESAVAYAWYIWQKGFKGTTSIKWFN